MSSYCTEMEATGYSRWFERLLAELGLHTIVAILRDTRDKRI
jgi:transposase